MRIPTHRSTVKQSKRGRKWIIFYMQWYTYWYFWWEWLCFLIWIWSLNGFRRSRSWRFVIPTVSSATTSRHGKMSFRSFPGFVIRTAADIVVLYCRNVRLLSSWSVVHLQYFLLQCTEFIYPRCCSSLWSVIWWWSRWSMRTRRRFRHSWMWFCCCLVSLLSGCCRDQRS